MGLNSSLAQSAGELRWCEVKKENWLTRVLKGNRLAKCCLLKFSKTVYEWSKKQHMVSCLTLKTTWQNILVIAFADSSWLFLKKGDLSQIIFSKKTFSNTKTCVSWVNALSCHIFEKSYHSEKHLVFWTDFVHTSLKVWLGCAHTRPLVLKTKFCTMVSLVKLSRVLKYNVPTPLFFLGWTSIW